jgi:hypothetical protein
MLLLSPALGDGAVIRIARSSTCMIFRIAALYRGTRGLSRVEHKKAPGYNGT